MCFVKVSNTGGSRERAMFAEALSQKSSQLNSLYDEVLDSIKKYEVRVGYQEIDEHKDKLLKVKQNIEELSVKINNTVNSLKG